MKKYLIAIFALLCLCAPTNAQLVGPTSPPFTSSSPGPIGGTTSSTGQFTQACTGPSPCTLPSNANGFAADILGNSSTAAVLGSHIATIVGLYFPAAPGTALSSTTGGYYGSTSQNIIEAVTSTALNINGNQVVLANATSLSANAGNTIQSTGGTAPTMTCSGGSAGVVVSAGPSSCTGSTAPFPCCTGAGTGPNCTGATNNRGIVQTSSSASTNCTITWSASGTWNQPPVCIFGDGSASVTPTGVAAGSCGTATCVFDFASVASKDFVYHCE